jgi:sugar lactone lactonase YvrE
VRLVAALGLVVLVGCSVSGCTNPLPGQSQARPTAPAWINQPFGKLGDITTDGQGNVYLTDWLRCRVEKLSPAGHLLQVFGSFSGCYNSDAPAGPYGVALDAKEDLWVSDAGTRGVAEFSPTGKVLTRWNANIDITSIAVSPTGEIVLSDVGDHGIAFFTRTGQMLRTIGSQGLGPGQFANYLFTLAYDRQGNLYVADHTDNRIQKFAPSGKPLAQFGAGQLGGFVNGLALDKAGTIYVQGSGVGIAKISPSGQVSTFISVGGGQGIAVDPSGNIWLADEDDTVTPPTTRLDEFSPSGKKLLSFSHPLA